jgi:uncharacterized membrane protein YqjE
MAKHRSGNEEITLIRGNEVYTSQGEKIGQVEETYYGVSGLVEWIAVWGDGLAGRRVLLPLKMAQIRDGKVYVPYSKEEVMSAPEAEDGGHIPEEAERWLYAHQESQAPEQRSVSDIWERRKTSFQAQQDARGGQGQDTGKLDRALNDVRAGFGLVVYEARERLGMNDSRQPTLAEELRRGQQEVRGISRDVAEIAKDLRVLAQQEMQLAKAEMGEQLRLFSRALVWGMIAATFGFLMLPFLSLAAMFALALVLPLWAAALATVGLLAILALGAGLIAYRQFRQVRLIPQRTMESVKEDVKWARSQWNSNGK